jgi:hypothetical protein
MSAFDKFKQLEMTFNKNFIQMLLQLKDMFEEDMTQNTYLEEAYVKWFDIFRSDPRTMQGCRTFYDFVKDNHEMVLKRDENLFTADGADFFATIYQQDGLDTLYLYNEMSDGMDTDNPIENDARGNLWEVIIGLYRISVLLCIYLEMPLVKDIIDMILLDHPDLNQSNIVDKIFKDFQGKKKLRRLIMKLMKTKQDNFADIFTSLQRVVASFSTEVTMDPTKFQNTAQVSQDKVNETFNEMLVACELMELKQTEKDLLLKSLDTKDEKIKRELISEGFITQEQLTKMETLFVEKNLQKTMNVSKVVQDLGGTMSKMMTAIESGSEEEMQKVFEEAGSSTCFNGIDLGKFKGEMQGEMEEFEEEEDKSE